MNASPQCIQMQMHYHEQMVEHYNEQINNLKWLQFPKRTFLKQQLQYHQNAMCELVEVVKLASEFKMSFIDLLHITKLMRQRMQAGEAVTVYYDPHRIVLKDHQGQVLAWVKATYYTTVKNAQL